jgi:hypothetical protein
MCLNKRLWSIMACGPHGNCMLFASLHLGGRCNRLQTSWWCREYRLASTQAFSFLVAVELSAVLEQHIQPRLCRVPVAQCATRSGTPSRRSAAAAQAANNTHGASKTLADLTVTSAAESRRGRGDLRQCLLTWETFNCCTEAARAAVWHGGNKQQPPSVLAGFLKKVSRFLPRASNDCVCATQPQLV